jgi:trk system potassium uptake protein TrkA
MVWKEEVKKMKIGFVGAGETARRTAGILIDQGHDVVIIESDGEKIEEISEKLDCSFLHGDGTTPALLKELGPKDTDVLYCLADTDQANLISSLVGRSLGFKRVITHIEDSGFEEICQELGLEDVIIPSRTIGRYLADILEGKDVVELSTFLRHEARFFAFVMKKEEGVSIQDMGLPEDTRVVLFYRDEEYFLPDEETRFQKDDEIVIITNSRHLNELKERWKPQQSNSHEEDEKEGT